MLPPLFSQWRGTKGHQHAAPAARVVASSSPRWPLLNDRATLRKSDHSTASFLLESERLTVAGVRGNRLDRRPLGLRVLDELALTRLPDRRLALELDEAERVTR